MRIELMRLGGLAVILTLISLGLAQPAPVLAVERGFHGALSSTPHPVPTVDGSGVSMVSGAMRSRSVGHTDRLIVKYRDKTLARATALSSSRVQALTARAGVALSHLRAMSGNNQLFKLPKRMTHDEAQAIAEKLSADPDVEYAVPDRLMSLMQLPNDPSYVNQWHYKSPTTDHEIAGINLPTAWDITTGSSDVVVGVIDTGIVNHADLQGRILPGYNFIHDPVMAGNGIGRSADASDLGDWVTGAESSDPASVLYGCPNANSSWHGTHVTGTIAATSDNGTGVTGINWGSKILPVRVLGKCGGYNSDVIDGMRWAAGLPVQGVPANANPAQVISMSLGSNGACDAAMQSAVNDVLAAGTAVVVAAGNSRADVTYFMPAGCNGVISVAALNREGGPALYTNYGNDVKISVAGGQQLFGAGDPNGVLSTKNNGTTSPIASPGGDTYGYYQGTSMAAPHVAGVVSLMLSLNPTLTPTEVLQLLQATARTFPTQTGGFAGDCEASICGAGIVDAYRVVQAVVSSAPVIGASPLYLTFLTRQGDPNPPSQSITIANSGGGTLGWSASSSASWLHVTPTGGSESGLLTVSVDTGGFAPATVNSATVTISAVGAANSPVTIPITVKFLLNPHAPLPQSVFMHAQASVGGKVYVIGGWPNGTLVQIYETDSDTWSMGTPKPTPADYTNAAVINGKIYVPGGYAESTGNSLNILEIYDPATGQWSNGAPLPVSLCDSAVEAMNGKLYVMGGRDKSTMYRYAYAYDPAANTWTRLADMGTARYFNASGVINGKIYLVGGDFNNNKSAEVYDPVANSWKPVNLFNDLRLYSGVTVLAGKLYAFGGLNPRIDIRSSLQGAEAYYPETDAWRVMSLLLDKPKFGQKATTVGNSIYVMGGSYPSGQGINWITKTNESYDTTQPPLAVTFMAGSNGTLTGITSQTVTYGASASPVTAVPAAGYHFVNWTGTGGFVTTTANPLNVSNVTAEMTITANFLADPVDGACGTSSGQYFLIAPTTNLCAIGAASAVTGSGPWNWACGGSNGGSTASCSTAMKGDANGDGKVDIGDALKVLRIAVGLETASVATSVRADVAPLKNDKPSPDGVINIVDALVILKRVVGLVNW